MSEETVILKTVGHGIAQSNVGPMGNILHISVQNWFSYQDGKQIVTLDEIETASTDINGVESRDKLLSTQTIHATWLPSGSNRLTAPNIRVGEEVEILQQSDTPVYYWRPLGMSEQHRKLETIIWGISSTKDEGADSLNPENRYWIEFSSHSKKIVLTTSIKNGEAVRYSCSFDLTEGIFNLMDSKGNGLSLESQIDKWTMNTARDCIFELNKKDLNIKVPGETKIITEGYTDIKSVKGIKLDGGGSTMTLDPTGIKLDGKGSTVNINPAGVFTVASGTTFDVTPAGIFWSGPIFKQK